MFKHAKLLLVGATLLLMVAAPSVVSASTYTLTWPEVNACGTWPCTFDAGTMSFPAGTVVSAVFSSTFGNSTVPNTAIMSVFVNGVDVGDCASASDPCWGAGSPTPFTYVYTAGDLASLNSGLADLTINQTDCCVIRLGVSTLVVTTVPEPGSMLLLGSGILGLAGAIRRKLML